jgi:hypothetical protein
VASPRHHLPVVLLDGDGSGASSAFRAAMLVGAALLLLTAPARARINNDFAGSISVWYDLHDFGKPWNDLEYHTRPSLRIGTAFTFAREDRLSDLSAPNPENNSIYISDGSLLFATGSVAPNVTIQLANYYLSAIDAGFKYRGLAVNAQLYQRWLNRFSADGPLPINSMYDWSFEASVGYFAVRSKLEPYARTSAVRGPFGESIEGAGGLNWFPLGIRGVGSTQRPSESNTAPTRARSIRTFPARPVY